MRALTTAIYKPTRKRDMQETYLCERCGTPFIRDRRSSRGCSIQCRRWLYDHQDTHPPLDPPKHSYGNKSTRRIATIDRTPIKEQRRNAMRRYRARKRAGQVAERSQGENIYANWVQAQATLPVEEQTCSVCHKTFLYDPASGQLAGCSQICRRILYRQQVLGT